MTKAGSLYMDEKDFDQAFIQFDAAYEISKQVHGAKDKKTVGLIVNCAQAKLCLRLYFDVVKLLEFAGKLMEN